MKKTFAKVISEESAAAENLRARSRLMRRALVLAISIVLLACLCFVVASHLGFEHMACKMAEDSLGSALSHSRDMGRRIQDSLAGFDIGTDEALRQNAGRLGDHLRAAVKDDPVLLYGMVLSKEGDILVRTGEKLEGARVWEKGEASSLSALASEFPRGRPGYDEFVYEVRTPLKTDGQASRSLLLGVSKKQVDRHIAQARRGVRLRILVSVSIGVAVLLVPAIALWIVLRRYRQISGKAQDMAVMAQMGRLANGLAHEIRNPLNAIRFNLKIMEEDVDHFPDGIRAGYEQIIRRASGEIDRLGDMLTEYLSYARPGHRESEPCDLGKTAESVLRFVEYECRRFDIDIERHFSPGLPKILADERRLKQAVLNVVLNAQQVLRSAGGTIQAKCYQHNGEVVLEIADDGPGVPEQDHQKIFEPFYSTREGGMGLGLAITCRVVEDHGGTVRCVSRDGRGAAFVMAFPRHRDGAVGKE